MSRSVIKEEAILEAKPSSRLEDTTTAAAEAKQPILLGTASRSGSLQSDKKDQEGEGGDGTPIVPLSTGGRDEAAKWDNFSGIRDTEEVDEDDGSDQFDYGEDDDDFADDFNDKEKHKDPKAVSGLKASGEGDVIDLDDLFANDVDVVDDKDKVDSNEDKF